MVRSGVWKRIVDKRTPHEEELIRRLQRANAVIDAAAAWRKKTVPFDEPIPQLLIDDLDPWEWDLYMASAAYDSEDGG